jgi:hypothetical protein
VNKLNRLVFGGVIGLMAGVSFHLTVLPFVAESILPDVLSNVYASMNPATFWLAAIWMSGGALAAWVGGARRGGLIFGLGGLIAGALFGLSMALSSQAWAALLVAATTGWLYGWGAGLLVGGGFGPAVKS